MHYCPLRNYTKIFAEMWGVYSLCEILKLGLPDPRNPWIGASHLRNTEISAPDNNVYAFSLTEDKSAGFLKTPVSLKFSDIHFDILCSE